MATTDPSIDDDLKRELLRLDVLLRRRQNFWETPKALAMILLAAAAISVAGGLAGWLLPSRPQQIVVHLDQPIMVRTVP